MQLHILRIHGKLVEYVGAQFQLLVVGIVLRQQRHSLGVARLSIGIFVLGEVDTAERNLADGFVDAVSGALLCCKHIV